MPLGDLISKFEKIGWAGSRFVIRNFSSRARSFRLASSSASVVRQSVWAGNAGPAAPGFLFGFLWFMEKRK